MDFLFQRLLSLPNFLKEEELKNVFITAEKQKNHSAFSTLN